MPKRAVLKGFRCLGATADAATPEQYYVDAGVEPVSLGEVLHRLCQDKAFLRALTEFILNEDKSTLASIAQVPLSEWRNVDASEYERYGSIFARSSNFMLAHAAAIAVSYGPPLSNPISEDLAILSILAKRQEGRVLGPVLFGLKRLVPVPGYSTRALDLYANMHVGNDHLLAEEYCNFFGMYGLSAASMRAIRASSRSLCSALSEWKGNFPPIIDMGNGYATSISPACDWISYEESIFRHQHTRVPLAVIESR